MIGFFLTLAVIMGGASVLATDLVGTRIMAPFCGAGLYLWTVMTCATFAALGVGYLLGSRRTDRAPTTGRLQLIIGLAGLWIAVTPWLRLPVLAGVDIMDMRLAVPIAVAVLFFPPLVLFGMISPYVIRLKSAAPGSKGHPAGTTYAAFMLAGFCGAIIAELLLLPHVGVYRSAVLIGFLLIGTALSGFAGGNARKGAILTPLILALCGGAAFLFNPAPAADPPGGLMALEESPCAEIRVVDMDDARYMLVDGSLQAVAEPAPWDSHLPYITVLDIAKGFFPRPGQMLLVGLGGGAIAKRFAHENWQVDATETNPDITRLARQYFFLKDDEAQVYNVDGRRFLATHDKRYDLIILDIFNDRPFPSSMVSKEAFALVRSRLSADGVLAMNVQAVGWQDKLVTAVAATVRTEFQHVLMLPVAEPPDRYGDIVIFASNRDLKLLAELPVPIDRFTPEYDRSHAWDNSFEVDTRGVPVLSDDFNPSDIWAEWANLVSRGELHAYFNKWGVAR